MSVELLHLIKKKTDVLVEDTKTSYQETLQFKMNLSKETFSFNVPLSLEESNLLLALTLLEFYNFIFNITKENSKFHSLLIVFGLIL